MRSSPISSPFIGAIPSYANNTTSTIMCDSSPTLLKENMVAIAHARTTFLQGSTKEQLPEEGSNSSYDHQKIAAGPASGSPLALVQRNKAMTSETFLLSAQSLLASTSSKSMETRANDFNTALMKVDNGNAESCIEKDISGRLSTAEATLDAMPHRQEDSLFLAAALVTTSTSIVTSPASPATKACALPISDAPTAIMTCPVCNQSFSSLTEMQLRAHVNDCLDRPPQPGCLGISAPYTAEKDASKVQIGAVTRVSEYDSQYLDQDELSFHAVRVHRCISPSLSLSRLYSSLAFRYLYR